MSQVLTLLLADGRLPVGGHTQSAGLEAAIDAGLTADAVPDYLRARLRTVVRADAGTAVVARAVATAQVPGTLAAVDLAWRARTASKPLRDNADLLGRGLAAVLRRWWPGHAAVGLLAGPTLARPVVLGVAAAVCGLSAVELLVLVGYEDAQTVAAAAVKLLPLDPLTATGWVVAVAAEIELLADDLADLTDPALIPAGTAPATETWAELHHRSERRLFHA